MRSRLVSLLTAPLLVFAANALAQSPPAQSTPARSAPAKPPASSAVAPVVVQAPAPANMVELRSYRFVEKNVAISNPEIDQVTRWRDPVCVQVVEAWFQIRTRAD